MNRRKQVDSNKKSLKIFFLIWLFCFVLVGFAFAGHTDTLTIDGMATIQSHIYDYVYITHTEVSDFNGGSSNHFSFLDHEIKSDVSLPSCNNYVTYRLSIVNGTPYKAFITRASLASAFNGNGNATNSFSVEFIDPDTGNPVVVNDTFIPRHSSKNIDVKIKNNCSGSDTSGVVTSNFEYSLYKYFDLTINSVSPSDGEITLTTAEGTYTGVGSLTHRVMEGETATYSVKKKYYYTANGSYTMMADDHTENISLIPDPHRDLTINTNVSSSTIVVKQDNEIICTGSGSLVCSVELGKNVTFTVDEPEYYYSESSGTYYGYSETFSMPATETTKSVTLTERPWITGTLSNTNRTTAATTDSLINWHPGYYLIELWGGKGGSGASSGTSGGGAGYVYGVIYIGYNVSVFATLGGNGTNSTSAPSGGANGGAKGGSSTSGTSGNRGSGGGYSAVVVGGWVCNANMINAGYVKFIAGGGAGDSARGGTLGTVAAGSGGAGGNLNSTVTSISLGKVFSGSNGTSNDGSSTFGKGGTSSAGSGGGGGSAGSMLAGGNGYERGGGGGAGYYGGGGGGVQGLFASHPAGGGGGSSFVASDVTYSGLSSSITSKLVGTNPSSTGGAIICTYLGKTM